jgi:hypothetical protein
VLAQQPIEGALVTRLSRFDQRGIVELDRDARTLPVGADSIMEVQVIVTSWMVSRYGGPLLPRSVTHTNTAAPRTPGRKVSAESSPAAIEAAVPHPTSVDAGASAT